MDGILGPESSEGDLPKCWLYQQHPAQNPGWLTFSQYQREGSFYCYKKEHKRPDNLALRCSLSCSVSTSRNHVQFTKVGNK